MATESEIKEAKEILARLSPYCTRDFKLEQKIQRILRCIDPELIPLVTPYMEKLVSSIPRPEPKSVAYGMKTLRAFDAHDQQRRDFLVKQKRQRDKADAMHTAALKKSGTYMGRHMCPAGVLWNRLRDKAFEDLSWCWERSCDLYRAVKVLEIPHKKLQHFCPRCCAWGYPRCIYSDVRKDPTPRDLKRWRDTLRSHLKHRLTYEQIRTPDIYAD